MTSTFVWHDLFTTNREASKEFYGALFGYTYEDTENGTTFSNAEGQQGSIIDITEGVNIPSHWLPYLTVDSTTEAAFRIGAGGGRLLSFGEGYVVFTDVEGAQLKIVQGHSTPKADSQSKGSIIFDELLCTNAKQSLAFFQNITVWNIQSEPIWPSGEYHFCKANDLAIAGIRAVNPNLITSSFWISYFKVDDLNESVAKVIENGGSVITPAQTLPGYGQFAVVKDNLGAALALLS
jgi:uncharacterized protein